MSKKRKKVCTSLNYIEYFLILASVITGCISIPEFASLIGVPIGLTNSAIGLKLCAITTGMKKNKSIIKKKKKKDDKIVLLAESRLNKVEVLISNALIDPNISHDEFVLINVLKQYDKMKEQIKNLKT